MKPHLPFFNQGRKKNPDKSAESVRVDWKRTGLAIATVAILSVLLSIHLFPSRVTLELGEKSSEDIRADRAVTFRDTAETELRRSRAEASAPKEYDPVPHAADQSVGSLKTLFHTVEDLRETSSSRPVDENLRALRERLGPLIGPGVSSGTLKLLLQTSSQTLRNIADDSLRLVSVRMDDEIHDDQPIDLREARKRVIRDAKKLAGKDMVKIAVGEVASDSLRPNLAYNESKTQARRDEAREAVRPVFGQLTRGEIIIAKNETVLQEHIDKFEALGLRHPRINYRSMISLSLLVLVAMVLVVVFLERYYRPIYENTTTLLLLSIIVIICTVALRIGGSMLGITLTVDQVGYLGVLWLTAAAMLVAVLICPQISMVLTALLSLVLSLMINNDLRFAASALMTALVGIYSVANLRGRTDLARAGGALSVTGVMLVWILGGINDESVMNMLTGTIWAGLVVPIGAVAAFVLGTAPLERLFGLTTHISLLELADTNKPLLRRLVMEAPGTYTHSMLVGHLAESAAEAVGADSLLARVASYYHDIGKIRRPHFFIENQNIENVHDRMNPTLSALVITSHIKDGVDVAKQFRLPRMVLDVMAQHHGTSLVQYFFCQMAEELDPCTALEHQFRYPGPKPQTREAGIVMLADTVEAASRSLAKPTRAKIELLVNRVIAEKLRDGQLDECELTFREISKITETFVRALVGTLHARMEYPEIPGETKRLNGNGDPDSKLTKEQSEPGEDSESDAETVID